MVTDNNLAPSEFVLRSVATLRSSLGRNPSALDVAMGRGRHAVVLAQHGFRVFGVDRDYARLQNARTVLLKMGCVPKLWVANLDSGLLPVGYFDLIVCTRFLQRTLWPALAKAVIPGGFVVYETFTTHQCRHDWGPRSPEYLLQPEELRQAFGNWTVWDYQEREVPSAEAGLLVRRPLLDH